MKCGAEDPQEICLADSCKCLCHEDMWKAYDEEFKRQWEKMGDG